MANDEMIIDGVLCWRARPGLAWSPVDTPEAKIVNALAALTDEQRCDVGRWFCANCGQMNIDGRMCQCWNDE
ncbi:MAG: hypothetical protein RL758_182 [Pseudomonadota bacterium]|jgi:hypothetical protein